MGVAGSGKSTVARAVALSSGRLLADGDDFHPPVNIRKMSAGIPLSDEDRREWLDRIARQLQGGGDHVVVSCSALKRAYRDRLRAAAPALRFVFLEITPVLAAERVLARTGSHFFPASVVASQFATLEDPSGEPGVLRLDGGLPVAELTASALAWAGAATRPVLPAKEPQSP